MSPVTLAFIGDGVFELLVRERLLANGSMPANKLHALAVKQVKASAQAAAYPALEAASTETELDILRRGRNANTSKVPKSCTPEDYRKATAMEALFGYLYLSGDLARIHELYRIVSAEINR
ncbi:ribonuclease III [Ruminococcaceae bacterium OttesenSCG-928-L11]|nr:ribonuclease III [Ruminococcaceae bacterium OttesenSCG-928-L11]